MRRHPRGARRPGCTHAVPRVFCSAEPWLSELSELSDTVGHCRSSVGHCRSSVGLSDCRTVGPLSDHCRTTVVDCRTSMTVKVCCHCRTLSDCRTTVGLSDCRTVGALSEYCRTTVGGMSDPHHHILSLSHGDSRTPHLHCTAHMHPWNQDAQCSVHTDVAVKLPVCDNDCR